MVSNCEARKSCVGRVGISILGSVSKGSVDLDFRGLGMVDSYIGRTALSGDGVWSALFVGGRSWMSLLHPPLILSTSNPSLRTLILPHESQFGGTRTLSLSMTLCLSACFFSSECIPSDECMSMGSELGTELEVYINDAPSESVSRAMRKGYQDMLTFH